METTVFHYENVARVDLVFILFMTLSLCTTTHSLAAFELGYCGKVITRYDFFYLKNVLIFRCPTLNTNHLSSGSCMKAVL